MRPRSATIETEHRLHVRYGGDAEQLAERRTGPVSLFLAVLALAAVPVGLLRFSGPPRLPSPWPTWGDVAFALQGTYVPLDAIGYLLAMAAWLLWGWVVASALLHTAVVAAEALSHGAAWVRPLRALSNRVTLPVVRRLIDGALVATVVVNLAGRGVPAALAAPLDPPETMRLLNARTCAAEESATAAVPAAEPRTAPARPVVTHIVRPNETLWGISEDHYQSGYDFYRIVNANVGRRMADGQVFTRAGVIRPGWELVIPLPSEQIEEVDGARYYVVQPDDTLQGIAARVLRDENAWRELFELNRGVARMPDGRTLTHQDLIWPHLRLRLPGVQEPSAQLQTAGPAGEHCAAPSAAPEAAEESEIDGAMTAHGAGADGATQADAPEAPFAEVAGDTLSAAADAASETGAGEHHDGATIPYTRSEAAAANGHAVAAALVAGAGAAALLAARSARWPFRRSLDEPPAFAPVEGVDDARRTDGTAGGTSDGEPDFGSAGHERVFAHRMHGAGAEPVVLGTAAVLRVLTEQGIGQVAVVTATHGRTDTGLTLHLVLRSDLGQQAGIAAAAALLGERLGASVRVGATPDHDVSLSLTGLRSLPLLAAGAIGAAESVGVPPAPLLLPVGTVGGQHVVYAGWGELGDVLVAGRPGSGADVALSSLVAGLAARRGPDALHLVTIGGRNLPGPLLALPHQRGTPLDPADIDALDALVNETSQGLGRRFRHAAAQGEDTSTAREPELVLLVDELAELQESGALARLLEWVETASATVGIRILAATTRLHALPDEVLARFASQVALRLDDEDASVRLLGATDAADLGSHGQLLLRIDRRLPVQLRGVRIAPDQLDLLVRSMRNVYAAAPVEAAAEAAETAETAESHETTAAAAAVNEQRAGEAASNGHVPTMSSAPSTDVEPAPTVSEAATDAEPTATANGHTAPAAAGNGQNGSPTASPLPDSSRPALYMRCFAPHFEVYAGERPLTPEASGARHLKPWGILAYLAAQPSGKANKERVLEAFWPDGDPASTVARLNTSLMRARKLLRAQLPGLAGDVVRSDNSAGAVYLDPTVAISDVQEFVRLCATGPALPRAEQREAYERAHALYRGDLLSEADYDWVHERGESGGPTLQERYREAYKRLTKELAQLCVEDGDAARAVELCRGLLRSEPLLEDVIQVLYRCYGALGDAVSLKREHRRLLQALRDAYGGAAADATLCQPEPLTTRIYEEVLSTLTPAGSGAAESGAVMPAIGDARPRRAA